MSNWRVLLIIVLLGVTTYSLLTWNSGVSTLAVSITPEGDLMVDGAPASVADLGQQIEAAVADGDQVMVTIQASPDSAAGRVVDIMNEAQAAGAAEVTLESVTDLSTVQTE